jgi:Ion channel
MNLMNYDKYEDVPHIQMYCDSLFFSVISMTGLGLTPMYPRTDLEYAIHSLMMLMGVSLYLNFFAFFAVTIYKNNR